MTAAKTKRTDREPLDRDRIVEAAIRLADADGLEGLSMRKLAGELGVEAMSLYYHVPNKETLLDHMVDRIIVEIGVPSLDEHWKTAIRRRAVSAHEVFQRHPWAIGITDSRTTRDVDSLRYYDRLVGCLLEGGFPMSLAAHALATVDAYVYGFGIQQLNLPIEGADEMAEVSAALLEQMPPDEFPYLTRMILDHALQPDYDYESEFTYGLDLILDALERELG